MLFFKSRQTGQSVKDGDRWFQKTGDFTKYLSRNLKDGVVADIGCGAGKHTKVIAQNDSLRVFAVDVDINNFDPEVKKMPNVNLRCESGDNLPFKNSTLDAIYSNHALEHFINPIGALQEWNRVLKKGGYLYLAVPPFSEYISPGHISMCWNIGYLYYMLGSLGFEVKSGAFKAYSHSIRAIVKKVQDVSSFRTNVYNGIFEHYPQKGSLTVNGIRRYKGDITEINWKEL